MNNTKKRFRLVVFAFETENGEKIYRHLITDHQLPVLEANMWLEWRSLKSAKTAIEYGKNLTVFFNYLNSIGIEYENASNRHVINFIRYLIYGDLEGLRIKSPDDIPSYSTLSKYITVITRFYKWLDENYETNMQFTTRKDTTRARKSFLYGQIYSYNYKEIVNLHLPQLSGKREYIKWYTDEEIAAFANNFLTLRDKAVFLVTLEGFRIDEALSMRLSDYDPIEQSIRPSRSKGKNDVKIEENSLRLVSLPKTTCDILTQYIQTERMTAESESSHISDFIFINLNKGNHQGKPLLYENFRKSMKRCAVRAGFDATKIRTHSGRSTKAMKCLESQAMRPEDGITDEMIRQIFGWKSADSIAPYRNNNNSILAFAVMKKLHKDGEKND